MSIEILKRNNVQVTGQGEKTLLFGHGFGCDHRVWSNTIKEFEGDYRVVTFDYVGSGNSDKTAYSKERYSTLDGYKQDLLEVCDALELKEMIFVGHSVSAMIGMLASIERPELMEKMVMIGPSPYYMNQPGYNGGFEQTDIDELLDMMETNYKEWAKYLAPVVMQNEERPQLAEEFEQLLCSNDPMIARQFAEVTFTSDLRDKLDKVTVPTLILQPKFDAIAPPEVGRYVHDHIAGSQMIVMEAVGHNPHLSDSAETAKYIKAYLAN
ncbi:alpha/beta hydrolase [Planococcus sp. CPCC 101016]|uniref:alpha/beta fold hydrolase n=1 Tax=Planococcus sp. CPCC 101016 TaxID=2599617 RepID=UPI0011B43956|nr:alpha/beta hydrolase [Planococcus sp. CPCC 101016]TWT06591.1 alpha/beta hydrolase [Planococcus sp. CPCC 101016]